MGKKKKNFFKKFLESLGPGFITGAADDDPSGIATYTQAGASFGYSQLWTAPFMLPFMIAVQEAAARIGQVTGKGVVYVIRHRYGKGLAIIIVTLVVAANTINIGADIGAMAAAAGLLIPVNFLVLTLVFAALILILEIFTSYRTYKHVLKWLALFMFSYVATVVIVAEPWRQIITNTFLPHVDLNVKFFFIAAGLVGTTISPYMFIWQANEEVEEEKLRHVGKNPDGSPKIHWRDIWDMRKDTVIGMLFSNFIMWCIIVTAATVLFSHGITVSTAADAAKALEPLVATFPDAGFMAKLLFSLGVIGLGLLAVPILSSSASYAVAEVMNWRASLSYKLKRAHGFYGVITIATLIGLLVNVSGLNPIRALVITAVINGIVAVPLVLLIALIASDKKVMGEYRSGWLSALFLWLTFFAVFSSVLALIISWLKSIY